MVRDELAGLELNGPVAVGKGTVIRPGAVIEGPVCIGDDCTIGPNCFIRPATTIGKERQYNQFLQ